MTVKELIEKLKEFDENLEVFCFDGEAGCLTPNPELVHRHLDPNDPDMWVEL